MPVLLLAYGDKQAKNLLSRAIDARYSTRPPVIETLQIGFKGRAHTRVGPLHTWVPVDAAAYFAFPSAMRWDFIVKPLGLPVQRGVEAYHENAHYTQRGSRTATLTSNDHISAVRRRLWAIAALMLTPLGEGFVKLEMNGDDALSFRATNTKLNDTVTVNLRPNDEVESVVVHCYNPDQQREQDFRLRISQELIEINDLLLPRRITAYWDDEPSFEVEPVSADNQSPIPSEVFQIQDNGASAV